MSESTYESRATGPFEVKVTPVAEDDATKIGRRALDKQFHGDLEGTSKGEMLTAGTERKESGVYVAVERVAGTLHGRSGTFALHHTGIMQRGQPSLSVHIVPDSGTGDLTGITGRMTIDWSGGKHGYVLEYSIE